MAEAVSGSVLLKPGCAAKTLLFVLLIFQSAVYTELYSMSSAQDRSSGHRGGHPTENTLTEPDQLDNAGLGGRMQGAKKILDHWFILTKPFRKLLASAASAKQSWYHRLSAQQGTAAEAKRSRRRKRNKRRRLLAKSRAVQGTPNFMSSTAPSYALEYDDATEDAEAEAAQITAGFSLDRLQQIQEQLITLYTSNFTGMDVAADGWSQVQYLMFDIDPASLDLTPEQVQQQASWDVLTTDASDPAITDSTAEPDAAADAIHTSNATSVHANASLASGKPKKPGTNFPIVPPGALNPRPPCTNGTVQQGSICVCPPGSGTTPNFRGCARCADGWVSNGGSLISARCKPCPDLTVSNRARTACVLGVKQPDVNDALCETCFNPARPFETPACCSKGQVCCGTLGCCDLNRCIRNSTTNFEPFCCESASNPCPNNAAKPFGLNCCVKGTTCLNTSSTTQVCCPIGGVCLGSTAANNKCCTPQTQICAVDRAGVAQCCNGEFCPGVSTNGQCCNAGSFCIESRLCCASPTAQVCRNPNDTSLAEVCCGVTSASTCISSPANPGLRLCCPTSTPSFVCGSRCCNRDTQRCINGAECCDVSRVCPSPVNPNAEICCSSTQICDEDTRTCVASSG